MSISSIVQIPLVLWTAIIMFICFVATWNGRRAEMRRSRALCFLLLADVCLLISDAMAYAFQGKLTLIGMVLHRIGNFFVFALVPVISVGTIIYILAMVGEESPAKQVWSKITYVLAIIDLLFLIISQFNKLVYYIDEQNIYHRTPSYIIQATIGGFFLIIILACLIYYKDRLSEWERYSVMTFIAFPLITDIFQTFYYGLSLNNLAITLAIFILFVTHEAEKGVRLLEQDRKIQEQELLIASQYQELAEQQNRITLSQVQPHFIFNVLGSIEQLCKMDPKMASDAVHHFAIYLRTNLNALSKKPLVNFEEEWSMIKTYLWLEKMRFGDELNYMEDVQVTDFRLPSMSVQPIVENAIKHAMRDDDDAVLNLSLCTKEMDEYYAIIIEDDGVGFDPDCIYDDNRVHIGMSNVRRRLEILCNGKMKVETEVGKGTKVTILIPKLGILKEILKEKNKSK